MFDTVNSKMTTCKTCGAEIAKSATVCPHCGAKRQANIGCLQSFFIALGFIFLLVLLMSMCSSGNKKSEDEDQHETEEYSEFTPIKQTCGRWEITVTGVEVLDKIKDGWVSYNNSKDDSKYLVVYATVKNNGNDVATFMPYLSFDDEDKCMIKYKDMKFVRTHFLLNNDDLCNKSMNPLEYYSGIIAFSMPESIAYSDEPLTLVIYADKKMTQFII